jgi:hypothetical protein
VVGAAEGRSRGWGGWVAGVIRWRGTIGARGGNAGDSCLQPGGKSPLTRVSGRETLRSTTPATTRRPRPVAGARDGATVPRPTRESEGRWSDGGVERRGAGQQVRADGRTAPEPAWCLDGRGPARRRSAVSPKNECSPLARAGRQDRASVVAHSQPSDSAIPRLLPFERGPETL